MKIVILDGHTCNPGDLSWKGLEEFGSLTVYPRSSKEEVLTRSADADVVIINKCVFSADVLAKLPKLRYIGLTSTGTNVVDLEAAKKQGVVVTNVPAYSTMSVAQHVFALLLEMTNQVGLHSASVHNGDWQRSIDFCYSLTPITELDGLIFGVIGFGNIGKAVSKIAQAFGMQVIAYLPRPKTLPEGVKSVDLETLFKQADVISLHCPLIKETEEMINSKSIGLMKNTSYIINTGRGGLVNEQDVAEALNSQKLAGFAADVLSTEPPKPDNPLVNCQKAIITPHVAWVSTAARKRAIKQVVDNLSAFKNGQKLNVVN